MNQLLLMMSLLLITAMAQSAEYVGDQACSSCHPQQLERWRNSHHAQAMALPTPETVLGDFENAEFDYFGQISRFFRDGDRYLVETDGADGQRQRFEVAYTFGVYPLQQYLLALPNGRYQAFSIAWDSRTLEEGGQRWYHLNPDEPVRAGDPLHWTGPYLNWNSRCAHCHSTAVEKGYDPEHDRYDTRWALINVSCESCHGPASTHLQWAQQPVAERGADSGLLPWPSQTGTELAPCAGCHSRRGLLAEDQAAGRDFYDHYQLRLPKAPLYHPDGQIRDEVFVYGSFLQSELHRRGVRCADCHDPHSLQLRDEGNRLCSRCHDAGHFDSSRHHHHQDGPGAQCVDCHMPATTYMGVDARRDHSFRVPRPTKADSSRVPDLCQDCHADRPAGWSNKILTGWQQGTAEASRSAPHYGEILSDGDPVELQQLAVDPDQAAIVRATAFSLQADDLDAVGLTLASEALDDSEPLVRQGAVQVLSGIPLPQRVRLLLPLLDDPLRSIRLLVFEALLELPENGLPPALRSRLQRVEQEYVDSLWLNADTPEGRLKLGGYYRSRGDGAQAETHYRKALEMNSQLLTGLINLADLYRQQDRDEDAQLLLKQAIALAPQEAGPHYALGLLRVRQKAYLEAAGHLQRAAQLEPQHWRYGYTQALALDAGGRTADAEARLEQLWARFPQALPILEALLEFARRQGHRQRTLEYAEQLLQRQPDNQALRRWVESLRAQ
ncbi:hypothetical protein DV711_02065 [Motiliproteus coralliicola]|uniref:Tetratricopeptide repeat protein n=1 Tax=Motiliproteus coralliicola TaxID=2283196 RepID=A0A369WV37_9GAMM|nr:multiheme c-type cytochrome [Motiliproteus coralliicola]RDE24396.1 hypothetical protein DV711_02065 [Motiliproteus coralliicola]